MDYFLQFIPNEVIVMHDLRLKGIQQTFFQLDTILLNKNFIVIVEVKHYSGHIYFDEGSKQILRKVNDVTEGLPNLLSQIHRQKLQLNQFLLEKNYPLVPIIALAVFSNPSAIIETKGLPTAQRSAIIRSEFLPEKLESLQANYSQVRFSEKQLHSLVSSLSESHAPEQLNILKEYQLSISDLKMGVECPKCNQINMVRNIKFGYWSCLNCSFSSKDAHIVTLHDLSSLVNHPLTNKLARQILQISSRHVVYRLLKHYPSPNLSQNLPHGQRQ
ncbi:NERD domain-containing protein [Bacillus gibsonii]|nr:NERD domain-containing protein [Alkalicoccobacillus gibsonii]